MWQRYFVRSVVVRSVTPVTMLIMSTGDWQRFVRTHLYYPMTPSMLDRATNRLPPQRSSKHINNLHQRLMRRLSGLAKLPYERNEREVESIADMFMDGMLRADHTASQRSNFFTSTTN